MNTPQELSYSDLFLGKFFYNSIDGPYPMEALSEKL
jgi:hypothetical protein